VSEPESAEESERAVTEIKIVKGNPTDEEVAALVTVLAGASGGGGQVDEAPQIHDLWGHPVDKLRYAAISWQRITRVERTHLRR
jgi:hypothetical protein